MVSEPQPTFNASRPNGGNPLLTDVNAPFRGVEFQYSYLIACAFVVWPIMPGIGLLYGGFAQRRAALALLFQSFMVAAVTTFQWLFWGYSLTYSRTSGPFIGNLENFGMMHVMAAPSPSSPDIPEIVFCYYQLLFCACTVMILMGGTFERGHIGPSLIFGFCWATVVYCPLACWTWNTTGWLNNLPALDYAGGGPVHIASGWSALAYALVLGKRLPAGSEIQRKPHNVTMVFLGTVLIWFGWFGFNGGSSLSLSIRSAVAIFNTNTAACTGVLSWVLLEYILHGRRFSLVGACEGAISGLVGITPAAGFVSVWVAAAIGALTALGCASLGRGRLSRWLRIDEGLDVFRLHGVGGMIGALLTGLFATKTVSALDGSTQSGGAVDHDGAQVARNLAEIGAVSSYAFVVSCVLLLIMKYIPGIQLRVSEEEELEGLDKGQFLDEQVGDWSLFSERQGIQGIQGIEFLETSTGTPVKSPGNQDIKPV